MIYSYSRMPEIWQLPEHERPRSLHEIAAQFGKPYVNGIWEIRTTDARTEEVLKVLFCRNVVTDLGAMAMLKNTICDTGGAVDPFKYIAIGKDAGSTKLSSGLTTATNYTSLPVSSLPANIPSGTHLLIGYQTAQEQEVVTSALANAGDTSISINSYTTTSAVDNFADVVPIPLSTDNPSSVSGAQYQTLSISDIDYDAGVGPSNRIATVVKKFLGASTTAGTYTSVRLSNANPITTDSVGVTLFIPQTGISSSIDQTFTAIIQI